MLYISILHFTKMHLITKAQYVSGVVSGSSRLTLRKKVKRGYFEIKMGAQKHGAN
jgi:hypothetical protein